MNKKTVANALVKLAKSLVSADYSWSEVSSDSKRLYDNAFLTAEICTKMFKNAKKSELSEKEVRDLEELEKACVKARMLASNFHAEIHKDMKII